MNAGDSVEAHNALAMKFFESARQEILERVRLRDNALFAYITVVGAALAFAATRHYPVPSEVRAKIGEWDLFDLMVTVPLPFICLIFSMIVLNHHRLIGDLGAYIYADVTFQKPAVEGSNALEPWNRSPTFLRSRSRSFDIRFWAQLLVFMLPLAYDLQFSCAVIGSASRSNELAIFAVVNLLSGVAVGITIVTLHLSIKRRRSASGKS